MDIREVKHRLRRLKRQRKSFGSMRGTVLWKMFRLYGSFSFLCGKARPETLKKRPNILLRSCSIWMKMHSKA